MNSGGGLPEICPQCGHIPSPRAPYCSVCDLPLTGPDATRAVEITRQIGSLQHEWRFRINKLRARRQHEHDMAMSQGRRVVTPTAPPSRPVQPAQPTRPGPTQQPSFRQPRKEWTTKRVQNLLLSLGAALCVIAALLFVGFAWGKIGLGGKAAIMAGVTTLTGFAGYVAHRRGLHATAESLTTIALLLAVIDVGAAYELNLANVGAVAGTTYWAVALGTLALSAVAYRQAIQFACLGVFALLAGQLPPILLLAGRIDSSPMEWAIVMGAQVVALVGLWRMLQHMRVLRSLAIISATSTWMLLFLSIALTAALGESALATDLGAVAVVSAAAAGSAVVGQRVSSLWATSATTAALGALAVGGIVFGIRAFDDTASALAIAVAALLLIGIIWPLRRVAMVGGMTVAFGTLAIGLLGVTAPIVVGLLGPWSWLGSVWNLTAGTTAQQAITPDNAWSGDATVILVLLISAISSVLGGVITGRRNIGAVAAAGFGAAAIDIAILVAPIPYVIALGVITALATILVIGSRTRLQSGVVSDTAFVIGLAYMAQALPWSLAATQATVVVVGLVALIAGLLVVVDPKGAGVSSIVASVAAMAWTIAFTQAIDQSSSLTGFVLVLSAGAIAVACHRLPPILGFPLLITSTLGGTTGLLIAGSDLGWLTWSLLGATVAISLVGTARKLRPALAASTLVLMMWSVAFSQLLGYHIEFSGFVVVAIATVVAVLADRVRVVEPNLLLTTSVVGTMPGLFLASGDAGWLAWTFLLAGAAVAIVSMLPHRRSLAWVSSGLMIFSLWTRLAMEEVGTFEAYSLPVALVSLVAGYLTIRKHNQTSSWIAYGPGLALAFTPSLLLLATSETLSRPALLAGAAFLALLYGADRRLQAPLAIGGIVLLMDALVQFGPYVNRYPRWITVGVVGALLVYLGATYERRLRDAKRIRENFQTLD